MRMKQKITSILLAAALLLPALAPVLPVRAATVSGWDLASEGQRNIVRRAYQMTEIEWTPVGDITGWRGEYTFKAGTTYKGLPYSQPINGKYVPFKATLEDFVAAVEDPDSRLYQTYQDSLNGYITMPYYGADCSSFVAWAWDVPRGNTRSLPNYSTKVSDYTDMQIGDGLIRLGRHATLITDITYDASGNITQVEICDANAYSSGSTEVYWCQRKTYTLEKFISKFMDNSYAIYRANDREDVSYTHSCVVPLEGDSCAKCGLNYYQETPCSFTATVDTSATLYSLPNTDSGSTGVLFGGSEISVTAYYIAESGKVWYKTDEGSWVEADRVTTHCTHSYTLTVTAQPTCTDAGQGSYTCSECMHSYIGAVPALGHSYSGGICIRCEAVYDPDARIPGDVDLNGALDTDDAVYLLLHIMFGDGDYPVDAAVNTDMDGNGALDTDDAVYLLLHVMFGTEDYPLAV